MQLFQKWLNKLRIKKAILKHNLRLKRLKRAVRRMSATAETAGMACDEFVAAVKTFNDSIDATLITPEDLECRGGVEYGNKQQDGA